ncbi:restriction endonuclease [Parafrankia discariae]|uniref:restriction endonuclease n=1 Tax=Parafrankia discariae TaxID=365528 RepID=UPI0003A9957F|nr:restriction endonuclease [Parafrankia discariae]
MTAVAFGGVVLVVMVQVLVEVLGWWTLPLGLLVALAAVRVLLAIRARRIREIGRRAAAAVLDTLSPAEFEQHVAHLLIRDGCRRVRVVGGRGDGGVDVLAHAPRGARIAVQCKHYRSRPVGPSEVRDFNGCAWTDHQADLALMVTSNRFTDAAAAFGRRHRIQMVDRELLARWMAGERILPGIPAQRGRPVEGAPADGDASR